MKSILFVCVILRVSLASCFGEVKIVAHRGASKDAPENTIPAFELAWEQGADAIEGDFRLTKDGHIVCIHDGDTKKVANTNLVVHGSTLSELRNLDVGARGGKVLKGTRIPTIDEVLATVPDGKRIYIEVKCGVEIIPPLLEEIKKSGLTRDQIVVISFKTEVIQAFKAKAPQYKAFWLCRFKKREDGEVRPSVKEVLGTLKQIKADGLSSNAGVQHSVLDAIQQQGLEWHVWTVNNPAEALRMMGLGAQSITTDLPGPIRKQLIEPTAASEGKPQV